MGIILMGNVDKSESIYRKNVIWNAVAGIINAGEAVVILAAVSRVNGLRDAGVLTLAFSLANLFMTIGKFGVRNYQVAHDGEDFSFRTFFHLRIITVSMMFLVSLGYVLYYFVRNQYTIEKCVVIFFVCLWYAVEAFEDVFVGKYQAIGRLDVGSQIFSFRWIITIVTFIIVDLIYRNIVLASICAFAVGLLFGIVSIAFTYSKYKNAENIQTNRGLKVLFKESIALCISSFLYFYMTNIPKYAINSYLGDELQAIYGYISMPIFVITLLNSFIYQPQLTKYVVEWRENRVDLFVNRVIRQLLLVLLIILVCLAGAYILGIPVLSILYHENLDIYRVHLLILLLGGGLLAVGAFLANMLTIINEQRKGLMGYVLVSVVGYMIVNGMVEKFQLTGAVWGYTITMFLLAIIFGGIFIWVIKKNKGESI